MHILGDGTSGPNGRSAESSDQQEPASDSAEKGVHGSLMQRYRNAGSPPAADKAADQAGAERPVGPPLPPPRAEQGGAPAPATRHSVQSGSWSASGTTAGAAPSTGSGTGWGSGTLPAAKPTAAPTTAATPAAPAAATPGAAPADGKKTILAPDQTTEFRRRWKELQGDFVDDPKQAVRAADDLTREVLGALTAKIADKKRVEGWKAGDGTAATEDLRQSLRAYRTLVDRLLEL